MSATELTARNLVLIAKLTGYILDATGSYMPVFFIAAFTYLVGLLIIHLLVPGMEPVEVERLGTL